MARASQPGGSPADADGPPVFVAEHELLYALRRLSIARSDEAWYEAVKLRDTALRRLLNAVANLPIAERDLVMARAMQALLRDRYASPAERMPPDDGADTASSNDDPPRD